MKNLMIILSLLLPAASAMAQDPLGFDEITEAAQLPAIKTVENKKPTMDDYELSRVVDDLMERVTTLEANQLDESDVEKIAEKVFKRMTIVVNKAEGGQELKTVEGRMSDGSILKTTLQPGQSFATAIDPFTGQVVTLGAPTMVKVQAFTQPVKQWQTSNFTVRQSPVLSTGQTIVGIQMNDQCFIDANGNRVCPQVAASMTSTKLRPVRQTTTVRSTTTTGRILPRLFGRR